MFGFGEKSKKMEDKVNALINAMNECLALSLKESNTTIYKFMADEPEAVQMIAKVYGTSVDYCLTQAKQLDELAESLDKIKEMLERQKLELSEIRKLVQIQD